MNKTANLLLVAMCTGLILAGCQKPAQPTGTDTQNVGGSISIEENKNVNASMSVTEAVDSANKATDAALDSANKAMEDANKAVSENAAYLTPEAKKAMEDANKAMAEANASTSAALDAAAKAAVEADASASGN